MKTAKKTDGDLDMRRKGVFAVGALIFAVIWLILWYIFPMEWYSFFFASAVGSYIQLALLALVLIFPMCWLLTTVTRRNISIVKCCAAGLPLMIAAIFLFSAFRYEMPLLVALPVILHIAAMIWVTASAKPEKEEKVKTKKQPVLIVVSAVLYVIIINAADIFLFWEMAFIYAG